jgi:hypothetical protein
MVKRLTTINAELAEIAERFLPYIVKGSVSVSPEIIPTESTAHAGTHSADPTAP